MFRMSISAQNDRVGTEDTYVPPQSQPQATPLAPASVPANAPQTNAATRTTGPRPDPVARLAALLKQ